MVAAAHYPGWWERRFRHDRNRRTGATPGTAADKLSVDNVSPDNLSELTVSSDNLSPDNLSPDKLSVNSDNLTKNQVGGGAGEAGPAPRRARPCGVRTNFLFFLKSDTLPP